MDRILITGVDSLLGQKIAHNLQNQGYEILGTSSRPSASLTNATKTMPLPDPAVESPWLQLLDGVTHVIHLDDYHALGSILPADISPDLAVTDRLAGAAVAKGVKRLLFVSSVQAMADHTLPGKPLAWRAFYQPGSNYGRLKLEAERLIARHCAPAGVEWQIIRPAEVYGPGIDSRLLKLAFLVRQKRCIAIGLTANQLAFVHIDNLADVIATAIIHPRGGNEALLVSDGTNVSTPELLRHIAHAQNRWLVLLPLPLSVFRLLAKDKDKPLAEQLIPWHSLAVDDSHTREALDWQPRLSIQAVIKDLVNSLAADT